MLETITPQIWEKIFEAIGETLIMVGVSGVLAVVLGLPLGVALFALRRGGPTSRTVNVILGVIVNIVRSFPYAILMVWLIPFTRQLIQTSTGPLAASVSLTIAAIPFFARLVERALLDLPSGKTDAALAMGSSPWQIVWQVWLPEAMPTLVSAMTTTLVTIVGYSAMAGIIGGGGLGRLAYNYGHQRFIPEVMFVTIVILIALVQLIQLLGDQIAKAVDHR